MFLPVPSPDLFRRLAASGKWLLLAGALMLSLAADCANHRQVFAEAGGIDFVDADCYSRMTRVREVCTRPGEVIRRHEFENYPFGTRPHTTIPFDYAVYAVRAVLRPFYGAERALDLAGAWISPLLGLLTVCGVWWWAERERLPGRTLALLVLAASPILAHGFALGRPDHQSLVIACMAAALTAEWALWRQPSRGWGWASGVAWAMGLWTSLYEPVILLAAVVAAGLIWNRTTFDGANGCRGWRRAASFCWRRFGSKAGASTQFRAWARAAMRNFLRRGRNRSANWRACRRGRRRCLRGRGWDCCLRRRCCCGGAKNPIARQAAHLPLRGAMIQTNRQRKQTQRRTSSRGQRAACPPISPAPTCSC